MLPLLALIIALFVQGDTGQLSGTVVDANNASIPNANTPNIAAPASNEC